MARCGKLLSMAITDIGCCEIGLLKGLVVVGRVTMLTTDAHILWLANHFGCRWLRGLR